MKRNDVFPAFAQKLGIERRKLQDQNLGDGKIYLPYFQDIFTNIKKKLKEERENYDTVDEFSDKSASPWSYLDPRAPVLTLARLLTLHSGRTASRIRAECTRPLITADLLWKFLAVQMETSVDRLNPEMKVREIRLPLAGYDKHSWLTFVIWADNLFGDGTLAAKSDQLADLRVTELFGFWIRS